MADLKLATREDAGVTVVSVQGSLDVFTAPQLDRAFKDLFARGRLWLVVDLSAAPFVGSAGWGVFLTNLKELRKRSGDLVLSGLDSQAQRIYEVFGLQDFLKTYPDAPSAARAVQPPRA